MSAKIRDTFQKAPSGWCVTDPLTKVEFESNSYRNVRAKVLTHRQANGIKDRDVDGFIHEQICAKNPPSFCQDWPTVIKGVDTGPAPSILQMLGDFTKAGIYWLSRGAPLASREKFQERIKICEACQYFDATAFWSLGKCRKCSCCTSLKPHLETAHCPLKPPKW